MKYVVVKTGTEINVGAGAMVYCETSLHDDVGEAIDKAKRMYGEMVIGYAMNGDLVATSFEQWTSAHSIVEAKVFGHQLVNVIAVNKVDEKESEAGNGS